MEIINGGDLYKIQKGVANLNNCFIEGSNSVFDGVYNHGEIDMSQFPRGVDSIMTPTAVDMTTTIPRRYVHHKECLYCDDWPCECWDECDCSVCLKDRKPRRNKWYEDEIKRSNDVSANS